MIVRDEEEMLEDCLRSARDFVEEIIVVDTGSTDATVSISERYGAKVFAWAWDGSFSNARNYSIEKAEHEWILLLDADERLVREDGQKLLDLIQTEDFDGAHFKVYNYVGEESSGQYTIHNALRLLRNCGIYRFKGDIHEQIACTDGQLMKTRFAVTDIRIRHFGYLDSVVAKKDKRGRNIPILLRELEKEPENPFMLFNLGNEYMAQRDYQRALELYEKAHARYNRNESYAPHLLFRSAMCCYNLERYGKAVTTLEEGLRVLPRCTDMEFLKGLIYVDWRRDTLAIESFQKAIAMGEPPATLRFSDGCATVRPLFSMALVYERQHDYAKAVECYTKAVGTDSQYYGALYGVAKCLHKMKVSPEGVEKQLTRFFSDLAHAPNRIVLVDILLSQRLCAPCEKHLEFLENAEGYEAEKALLLGSYCLYTKQYEKSYAHLSEALRGEGHPRVLANARKDSALLLFAVMLMTGAGDKQEADKAIGAIGKGFGRAGELVCRQIQILMEGKSENLLAGESPKELLDFFSRLQRIILDSGEFELFEKLLYLYNYMDSPRVLLSLAELYLASGFLQLAASTVLRSIKELDAIDACGASLLAAALFEERDR